MAASPVEQVKEKLEIVEFLKSYLKLEPAGKNFKALCPFHHEKSPSFMVSPERQTWHCFGCALGGDIFSFVMKHETLEFGEALRVLAEKAGIELKRLNPAEYKFSGLLYEINAAAKEFWRKKLHAEPKAQQYLKERGLTGETAQEFEVGWAPNETEALAQHLMKAGYSPDDVLRAGLTFKPERRSAVDRFRGRIMFPIHDHFGKVVGFTGRILPEFDRSDMGKYVNSPETAIFNKSKLLYGFWKTKASIREAGSAFLVEGQMDFLMSWQAGIKNVIASSGTALTPDHLRALRRVTDQLVLSFDNDEAGLAAGERAIDLAEANDFNVRVLVFRDYKDPGEAAQANEDSFRKAVLTAKPAPEFYFDRYLPEGKFDHTDRTFLKKVRTVLSKLMVIASPIEQSAWVKKLAERLHINESVLREEAEKLKVKAIPQKAEETEAPKVRFTRWELLGQKLLSLALAKNDFEPVEEHAQFLPAEYKNLYEILKTGARKSPDAAIDDVLNLIALQSEPAEEEEIRMVKDGLFKEYLIDKRRELAARVREAEALNDQKALESALIEFNNLPVV